MKRILAIILLAISQAMIFSCARGPHIDVWYGSEQHFGHLGNPQKWINILGRISADNGVSSLQYSLNNETPCALSIGPDRRRLAYPGDFNIEIDRQLLKAGENNIIITATDSAGKKATQNVTLIYRKNNIWPLPYSIDWSQAKSIQDVAQVVDGKWQLGPDGVRILEPYYDRAIAIGDLAWTDYEVKTEVTFHGMRIPQKGKDGGANVIHVAIAVRWPGHDEDGNQPHVKWYPLGATAEFRLTQDLQNCSWRILGDRRKVVEETKTRPIELETMYLMKHRVESLADSSTLYRVKLWRADSPEPEKWDVEAKEDNRDVQSGGALLIAHYSDVTFGNISVEPVIK